MSRSLETRLERLEQRQQPHSARDATAPEIWRELGITLASFARMANSVDAKEQQPPEDCTPAECHAWLYLRDVLHFDELPF